MVSLTPIDEENEEGHLFSRFVIIITHESCVHCQHFHKTILDKIILPKMILNVIDLPRVLGIERMTKLLSKKLPLPFIIKYANGKMERIEYTTQEDIPFLLNG